jgi:protein-S-isoprenylcysteine O-methyltransferase Ste14
MNTDRFTLLEREFESRIFVSLGIAAAVCTGCVVFYPHAPSSIVLIGALAGKGAENSLRWGFGLASGVMALISLFRMWGGSELTSPRVMAFRVQVDVLSTGGPYMLVRNPIYLADFTAICLFSLCLPPAALLMPALFWLHYRRLIAYEELSLAPSFRGRFDEYAATTPRLVPSLTSLMRLPRALSGFRITPEGMRHNSLYVLFIPGFIAAAITGRFLLAVLVGLPGVADWAVVHTKLGVRR